MLHDMQKGGNNMTELEKAKQVFESIIGLCNEMTTANISHHRSTIKLQAEYGLEKIENLEKPNMCFSINKMIENLEVEFKKGNKSPSEIFNDANEIFKQVLKLGTPEINTNALNQ